MYGFYLDMLEAGSVHHLAADDDCYWASNHLD